MPYATFSSHQLADAHTQRQRVRVCVRWKLRGQCRMLLARWQLPFNTGIHNTARLALAFKLRSPAQTLPLYAHTSSSPLSLSHSFRFHGSLSMLRVP